MLNGNSISWIRSRGLSACTNSNSASITAVWTPVRSPVQDMQSFPAYADLVAGTTGEILLDAADPLLLRINNYSLFAQDAWRAKDHLTVTYGLRWEINTPPASASASQPLYVLRGIFDSQPMTLVPGALWHTRYGNFAPRLGAAYQVTPKTVVRGGFGLFYDLGYGNAGHIPLGFLIGARNSLTRALPSM